MFDEFANRTRGKIRYGHGRRGGAALELPRYVRIQHRQDASCDIGPVKLRDEFSEHGASVLRYWLSDQQFIRSVIETLSRRLNHRDMAAA